MNDVLFPLSNQLTALYYTSLTQTYAFLPNLLGAIFVLLIGTLIAKTVKRVVEKSLELLKINSVFRNTPVEAFLKHADLGTKVEKVAASIVYWLLMLLVLQTVVSILGLSSLAYVLDRVLSYIPQIFSAIVVLFLGVLIAGVLESIVKGSIRSIDGKHGRFLGKVASYLTLIIFVLVAISELGIAQDFIIILFIGFVTTITLSLGLSIGLGSKEVVGNIIEDWYSQMKKELKTRDE